MFHFLAWLLTFFILNYSTGIFSIDISIITEKKNLVSLENLILSVLFFDNIIMIIDYSLVNLGSYLAHKISTKFV